MVDPMIIGIVGSRTRNSHQDKMLLRKKITELDIKNYLEKQILVKKIVTGDCEIGADKFARSYANDFRSVELEVKYKLDPLTGKPLERYIPDYFEFCKICYDRNEEIAKEPLDFLIALVTKDRKGGTEKTIKYFKKYHRDWEKKLILI